jgi:hypothetical protein
LQRRRRAGIIRYGRPSPGPQHHLQRPERQRRVGRLQHDPLARPAADAKNRKKLRLPPPQATTPQGTSPP